MVSYLPSIVCTIAIMTMDGLYKNLAEKIVSFENHADVDSYEKSLTVMIYKFTFWNSYSYCLILAFWERNFSKLAQQLGTILIVKQVLNNMIEYL